jgi:hypothetical protein
MKALKLTALAALATAMIATPASAVTLLLLNDSTHTLDQFDTVTSTFSTIGALGTNTQFGDLAYDGTTLWALGGRGNNALYTINIGTGAATLVGNHGIGDLFGLAFDTANGKLYATQFSGGNGTYTLNLGTGAATLLSATGSQIGGLTYRADTNQIVGTQDGNGDFYTIDPTTGAKTLLNAGSGGINDSDLDFDAANNAYWLADYDGNVYRYDATTFARTLVGNKIAAFDGLVVLGRNVTPAVPEPATWGLMLAGFGIVGGAMRRRHRTSVSFG